MNEPSVESLAEWSSSERIARIQRGDVAAFDELFREYASALYMFAESYGRVSHEVAEDIVCDVFGWVWRHREHWNPNTSIEAYLYGAIRNKLHNRSRDLRRDLQRKTNFAFLGESPGHGQPSRAIDATLEASEEQRAVRTIVQELPEPQRLIILLRWTKQWSWQEVAEVVGLSTAAAKMHHVRALKTLRSRFAQHFIK